MNAMDMLRQNPARLLVEAIVEVLRRPAYLLLATAVAVLVLAATLWLPNYRLLGAVFTTPGVALGTKWQLLASLAGGLAGSLGVAGAVTTTSIPVLFGVDVALIVYFARQRRARLAHGEIAASVGGAASGAIAAGCAACGSFLLLPLLSFLGAAGVLVLLPLGGAELGLVSIGLLLLSIYLIARKIATPPVCELPSTQWDQNRDRGSPTRNVP